MSRKPAHSLLSKRTVIVSAVVAGCLVLVAAGFATSSPGVCGSCHTMRPYVSSLAASQHSQVHCYRCHGPGGLLGAVEDKSSEWGPMLFATVQRQGLSGPTSAVSSKRCLACHGSGLGKITRANGLRIAHDSCVQAPAQCTDCHSTTAHGTKVRWISVPVMEECIVCHKRSAAPVECDTCHEGRGEKERLAVGPWQVTHGPQWRETHGQARLGYCITCHPEDYCVRCHATRLPHPSDFGRVHGDDAKAKGAKCLSCHQKSLCDSCHGIRMPHPVGFLKRHSSVASSTSDELCKRCHVAEDCEGCHVAHTHPGRTDGTLGKGPDGAIGVSAPGAVR